MQDQEERSRSFGIVFDAAKALWQAINLEMIVQDASVLAEPVEERWLVKYSSAPIDPTVLPVQAVEIQLCLESCWRLRARALRKTAVATLSRRWGARRGSP
eukprot:166260-Pleurochrysis_carterae.AAC.1